MKLKTINVSNRINIEEGMKNKLQGRDYNKS
jgi:hypothetical protein